MMGTAYPPGDVPADAILACAAAAMVAVGAMVVVLWLWEHPAMAKLQGKTCDVCGERPARWVADADMHLCATCRDLDHANRHRVAPEDRTRMDWIREHYPAVADRIERGQVKGGAAIGGPIRFLKAK